MTSCAYAFGLCVLGPGTRKKPNPEKKIYFNFYDSIIGLRLNSSNMPCSVRTYSPYQTTPLPEDTVVMFYAKFAVSSNGILDFNVMHIFPAPGVPSDEEYLSHQLPFREPIAIIMGSVV
ncbi:hypothetical protein EV360DRAFT_90770, partial [Lentinula raphanica]